MGVVAKSGLPSDGDGKTCLARSVLEALADDPTLEAVTINRARHSIPVATLGKADVPKLTERISATFQGTQTPSAKRRCTLLAKIHLAVGVVGHEGSTVIVVMNSLRLLLGHHPQSASLAPAGSPIGIRSKWRGQR